MILLLVFQCSIFLLLGGIHFYWAFGGTWGLQKALPQVPNVEKKFNVQWYHSAIVGFILLIIGVYYGSYLFIPNTIPTEIYKWLGWCIGLLFILRSIGDFNYVGFFKKVKTTTFAKYDSKLYSPLCLLIGCNAFLLA